MSDECPVCGKDYSSFAKEKYIFHDYGVDGLDGIRVCPDDDGAFVHLWERKHTITFLLHDGNPFRDTIEIHERNEVRQIHE